MVVAFDTPGGLSGDVTIVDETDDGTRMFERLATSYGPVKKVAIGARTWGTTTVELVRVLGGCDVVNADRLVNPMRRVKSPAELEAMTRACRIADEAMGLVSPAVRAGVSELELARDVDHHMRTMGSVAPSFDTGVWSMGEVRGWDATVRLSAGTLAPGLGVSFDLGAAL